MIGSITLQIWIKIITEENLYFYPGNTSHEMFRTSLHIILILSLAMVRPASSQDLFEIDSLITLLNEKMHDSVRCRILLEVASEIGASDTASSWMYVERARQLAEKLEDTPTLGRYQLIRGKILYDLGEYDEALAAFDRAMAHFSEADDLVRYYETVKNKGNVYLRRADYPQALSQYNTALDYYRRNGMDLWISRCLNNIGIIHKNRGEYDEALWAYEESIVHLEQAENSYEIAQAYINMGNVFVLLGVYEQALDYFTRALDISEEGNYSHNITLCLSNLGVVQNKLGNFTQALNLYQRSLEASRAMNDPVQISNCLINLGTNYAEMGELERGIDFVQQGLEIKTELGDERAISNCHIYLAEIHSMMKENDRAIELFNLAIPEKERLGDQEGLVQCYLGMGKVLLNKKQYQEAIAITDLGMIMADTLQSIEHLATGSQIMKEIALANGNYRSAYENAERYHLYQDSLMNEATARAAIELEFKNRSKALEQENENLRIQTDLSTELVRKRNALLFSVMGFTLLLVAGLVLLGYFLRKLRIASQKLQEKNIVITKQNLKLDQLNTTKDQMMSIIAHDLRGTIGNQLTAIEVIHDLECENESGIDRKRLFGNLKHSASYSLELLENLLHWSRLGENDSNFHPEEVNLANLIENCVVLYDEASSLKNISIEKKVKNPLICNVDKMMFETILRNLISNAVKFSNTGGHVLIEGNINDEMLHVKVTDRGIGMNPEQLGRLNNNDRFTRRGTANEKGAGIGLTLVREFTALHRGNLKISSNPGEGSTFEIVVPCRI